LPLRSLGSDSNNLIEGQSLTWGALALAEFFSQRVGVAKLAHC
jgi:hypothetical protein